MLFNIATFYEVDLVLSGAGRSFERSHILSGSFDAPTAVAASRGRVPAGVGTVFARVGSGGDTAFGAFASGPVPEWSAERDNERATYALLTVKRDDRLTFQVLGIPVGSSRAANLDVLSFD